MCFRQAKQTRRLPYMRNANPWNEIQYMFFRDENFIYILSICVALSVLTAPSSIKLVSITTLSDFNCQIILQKSSIIFFVGPYGKQENCKNV